MYSKLNGNFEVENAEGVVLRDGKVFQLLEKSLLVKKV